jgi:hypothetical protein
MVLPTLEYRSFGYLPDREETLLPCAAAYLRGRDWWFAKPGQGGGYNTQEAQAARLGCRMCPVTDPCLEDALRNEWGETNERHRAGIWGGLTPRERIAEERRRRAGVPKDEPPLRAGPSRRDLTKAA